MKTIATIFVILLICVSRVSATQWSSSTVLTNGVVLYTTVTTGNLIYTSDGRCQCSYTIQYYLHR